MRPYLNVNVGLRFQNCGSVWLMVLTGSKEDIESVSNGFFNLGACGVRKYRGGVVVAEELEYFPTNDDSLFNATFWSTPEKIYKFFFNLYFFRNVNNPKYKGMKGGIFPECYDYAEAQIDCLKAESAGFTFLNFNQKPLDLPTFGVGAISAERPDSDFKDAVLNHSFADKEDTRERDMHGQFVGRHVEADEI